jgi:adenine-specific DNA-methyltransferase
MDEVFGSDQFVAQITFSKTAASSSVLLSGVCDYLLWFAKDKSKIKYRELFRDKRDMATVKDAYSMLRYSDGETKKATEKEIENPPEGTKLFRFSPLVSQNPGSRYDVKVFGKVFRPEPGYWKTDEPRMQILIKANVIHPSGKTLFRRLFLDDFPCVSYNNIWTDTQASFGKKTYIVQTNEKVIQRCLLMATDPGDLVLDPTCGSGTTAFVSEQWGRRWITIDTSRVALALARARIMGARYPYYLLKDSRDGQLKESEISQTLPSQDATFGNIRQGFVYERVPHITLKSIANNSEIDVICDTYQEKMEPVRARLNKAVSKTWEEWEIPHEVEEGWSSEAETLHSQWWQLRIARQKEIDASIAAKAENEYLYDKPYEDNKKVRVAGPFTVESLSPHRTLGVDENDELIDNVAEGKAGYAPGQSFEQMILENLKTAGVQQAHKEDKINFFSLTPWPGHYICAEGRYFEGGEEKGREKRAGIFIGPEFGTVSRPDLVAAAREAGDAGFDVLIACAFNYVARSTEFSKLGAIPVLKARMNADLHMADDLKNTGKGNLFVIFGEPDIEILDAEDGKVKIKINGVDVFHPGTGEVRSNNTDEIACWFIDTDYNEESFFVRHAYFLGANDPYSALKTTLKAEVNEEAWASLNSDVSRPFEKPGSGRIAVKVINHLGDEVMKVFKVN